MTKKEKEKITVGIYLIDLSLFIDDSFEAVTQVVLKSAEKEDGKYEPEKMNSVFLGAHKLKLFYKKRTFPPRWKGFLNKILAKDATLRTSTNTNHDFLLFIEFSDKIFVISGGTGSITINRFVSQSFGIDILCRLIERNSQVIKSIQERGVTGVVLGQTRFYRDDQRLSDENQFGKIYKEVKAELNAKILKSIFGFKDQDLKKKASGCLAKSSFQINKLLDFDEFLRVIEKVSSIYDEEPNFTVNNVKLITGKSDDIKKLKNNLIEALVQILYEHYENGTDPDFDFCHKDFEKFLTAPYYFLCDDDNSNEFDGQPQIKQVFQNLKQSKGANVTDEYTFKHFILLSSYLEARDDNGVMVTRECVMNHIHGEITYNGLSYFIIDGQWYKVNPEFVQELNSECRQLFVDAWDDKLITQSFDQNIEREFNESFIGQSNTLVFDTITSEKIECCDILKYNDSSIYLIHVKRGFDNSIRDLAGQIAIAARRMAQDRVAGYRYIEDIEAKTKSGKFSTSEYRKKLATQSFPVSGLKSIFLGKREINICFCLGFVDVSEDLRSLKDNIEKFNSNIAKYSLIDARKGVKQYGFDFKVIQFKKSL